MSATAAIPRPAPLNVEDIGELLLSVNEVTARLQATHDALRNQVASLQSELASANEQLRRSRSLAALGEMAAGIAHEIRNPLGSIVLDVEMLEHDLAASPEHVQTCRRINDAANRMDSIVRDVLAFAHDRRVRPEPVEVEALFHHARAQCESMMRRHRIELESRIDPNHLEVAADTNLVIQAIANLLRNGIEAIADADPPERRMGLDAARRRVRSHDGRSVERIVLGVEDTGPGIPPEVVMRMFNPFFTTRPAGTGLGLAIVHRIVDAHGGEVDVQHRSGGGTRIELRLPPES